MATATKGREARIGDTLADVLDQIEQVVTTSGLQAVRSNKPFQRAIRLAEGIRRLREIISLAMIENDILSLQNTPLGFRTDKPEGYTAAVVRDALIEALLRGALPVGNEFNIIAGRCYLTREFFERAVAEFPGLSDLRVTIGVPVMRDGGALVTAAVAWKLGGTADHLNCLGPTADGADFRIPVRVNSGMGADAIIGKARRKVLARVYQQLAGPQFAVPDGDADETRLSDVRERATVDVASIRASAEPNRGHNGSDIDRVKPAAAPAQGELGGDDWEDQRK